MSETPQYKKWSEIRPTHTSSGEPRPDPYEDELTEGFGQDAASREDISAVTARLVLRGLRGREADWRRRVGDEDYERAVAYWQAAVEGHPRPADPFSGDEEYEAFLVDLRRSRREEQ